VEKERLAFLDFPFVSLAEMARVPHHCHKYRTHLSLEKEAPELWSIQAPNLGEIIEIPDVGGLQHHYKRRAA
jgi:putative transposase